RNAGASRRDLAAPDGAAVRPALRLRAAGILSAPALAPRPGDADPHRRGGREDRRAMPVLPLLPSPALLPPRLQHNAGGTPPAPAPVRRRHPLTRAVSITACRIRGANWRMDGPACPMGNATDHAHLNLVRGEIQEGDIGKMTVTVNGSTPA